MNKFPLLFAAVSTWALFFPALAGASEPSDWQSKIKTVQEFTARSDDGDYRLEVRLYQPKPVTEKSIKTAHGSEIRYEHKGKLLPAGFAPGQNLIGQFKFFHNDKEIPIDPKYWKDITGLLIQQSSVDTRTIPEDRQEEYSAFLESLPQPRIHSSSIGDTILIEWLIRGEGGSMMAYRWMIGSDGKTLFHCFMPLVGC